MTVNATQKRYRTRPVAPHAYTVPVVRELPSPAVAIHDSGTW